MSKDPTDEVNAFAALLAKETFVACDGDRASMMTVLDIFAARLIANLLPEQRSRAIAQHAVHVTALIEAATGSKLETRQ